MLGQQHELCTNCVQRGNHNIEDELIFRSNSRFVFHDSQGFETGSVNELNLMKVFVNNRATTMKLENRIHAIWWDHGTIHSLTSKHNVIQVLHFNG